MWLHPVEKYHTLLLKNLNPVVNIDTNSAGFDLNSFDKGRNEILQEQSDQKFSKKGLIQILTKNPDPKFSDN